MCPSVFSCFFSQLQMAGYDALLPEILALLTVSGLFSDEDVLLLLLADAVDQYERIPDHKKYDRFDLESVSCDECKHFFRFQKEHIPVMAELLHMPEWCKSKNRVTWNRVEGLCVLLHRLAYPNRLADMVPMFGSSTSELCEIFNTTLHDVYTRHAFRVQTLNQPWVDHDAFVHAVFLHGGLPYIWAFIDGTIKKVCKPGVGQQHLYSGHKRVHGVKYQHTMAPNGLVVHCFGPFKGRQPDATMYHDSSIDVQLQPLCSADGSQLALYGDGGYALRPWLFTPFRNANTQHKRDFNAMMAQARICVEWGFGKVSTLFAFVNYYANQKFFL